MAKSKEYMALYRSRMAFGGVDGMAPYEGDRIGGRTVESILDEAEANGGIVYEKPRSEHSGKRTGGHDLFAHAALYEDGWRFTVLRELSNRDITDEMRAEGKTQNVDLVMRNGIFWEVKSPDNEGRGKKPRRFVKDNIDEARHQFRNHIGTSESDTRIVFNSRFTTVDDDLIAIELGRLVGRNGVAEIVHVRKDGKVIPIKGNGA